jgi:hypothetical protein
VSAEIEVCGMERGPGLRVTGAGVLRTLPFELAYRNGADASTGSASAIPVIWDEHNISWISPHPSNRLA